jgi:GT2 family glycosyltransferase
VTVLVPTIGRPELLRACLESLARCDPPAAEVLVADQSGGPEVEGVVASFASAGARSVTCGGRGVAFARNAGLRAAAHEIVLATDDDCTVSPDWVEVAWRLMQAEPHGIVTGRVLPAGDPARVPSTIEHTSPRTYANGQEFSVLFTNNMVGRRSAMLALGGFDERIRPAASDNEFSYRWLRSGRPLRYEPDLVVWHHDWRTREQLVRLYINYAEGQGMVYAKHLLARDLSIGRFLLRDVYLGCRGVAGRLRHGHAPSPDWRLGLLRGLPVGLARGVRTFGLRRTDAR